MNIIIKKVWEDDFSAKFNIKFESEINSESFIVSGNFYLSGSKEFEQLSKALVSGDGEVLFKGIDNNFCKLKISTNSRGLRNIHYHILTKEEIDEAENSIDVSINTGYIIETAFIDRISQSLKDFYNEPEGAEISLVASQE